MFSTPDPDWLRQLPCSNATLRPSVNLSIMTGLARMITRFQYCKFRGSQKSGGTLEPPKLHFPILTAVAELDYPNSQDKILRLILTVKNIISHHIGSSGCAWQSPRWTDPTARMENDSSGMTRYWSVRRASRTSGGMSLPEVKMHMLDSSRSTVRSSSSFRFQGGGNSPWPFQHPFWECQPASTRARRLSTTYECT